MMTQLEAARHGVITEAMRRVAEREAVTAEWVRDEVARGRLVIPANVRHLAGSAGCSPAGNDPRPSPARAPSGDPDAPQPARHWVHQTAAQRARESDAPPPHPGQPAPKPPEPPAARRTNTPK